jgi:hypothetical protein
LLLCLLPELKLLIDLSVTGTKFIAGLVSILEELRLIHGLGFLFQELKFIAGLVRVGSFDQAELVGVLHLLYPQKTDAEINAVMKEIFDPTFKPIQKDVP